MKNRPMYKLEIPYSIGGKDGRFNSYMMSLLSLDGIGILEIFWLRCESTSGD